MAPDLPELPDLETARLRLRPLAAGDLEVWHQVVFTDPEVTRYLPARGPAPKMRVAARLDAFVDQWEAHGIGVWAVLDAESGAFAGHCGFILPEAGPGTGGPPGLVYALGRAWWGRGLATEAAMAALEVGFGTCGFRQVVADVVPANAASARVLRKLGFTLAGVSSDAGVQLDRYRQDAVAWRARPRHLPGRSASGGEDGGS